MFEKEFKTLKEHSQQLKLENPHGGFVVINEEEILGVWLNRQDALKQGIEQYGNQPFLVRNLQEQNSIWYFTRAIFEAKN